MKVCSNCQSNFTDDSLQFCLNCGTPLANSTDLSSPSFHPAPRKKSNAAIVVAILSGFLLLAIVVGALGVFYFNRENSRNNEPTAKNAETSANAARNAANQSFNRNAVPPAVQIEANTKSNQALSNVRPPIAANARLQSITSASSVRKPDKGNFYFPNFASDGNSATAWCEGAPGAGAGEWLKFEFDREATLRQIKIQPGYFKNAEVWSKNNRVAEITLEFSDGSIKEGIRLQDSMQTQTIDVGRVRTSSVKIIIDEYYSGATDSFDTLVSEVSFVTEP